MKFGRTIKTSLYPEWSSEYLQYSDLKKQIKKRISDNQGVWTDKDEDDFVESLRQELDKVYSFQKSKVSELTGRIEQVNNEVNQLLASRHGSSSGLQGAKSPTSPAATPSSRPDNQLPSSSSNDVHRDVMYQARDNAGSDDELDSDNDDSDATEDRFLDLEEQLASIIADVHDLALFTKLNYTGFLKIVKKHDKQTGRLLRKEFVQHYLTTRPFYKENYDALIVKLSRLFDIVHSRGNPVQGDASAGGSQSAFVRQTTKYWVHPDNIVPLKLFILKHLPVLVFNTDKEYQSEDSAITSIYYDNEDLELYLGRLEKTEGAEAIRLRWYGGMDTKTIFVERKTHREDWTGEKSVKARFPIKEDKVNSFMRGEFRMNDTFEEMRKKGKKSDKEIDSMLQLASEVQYSILSRKLQPVMRSFYNRTAFQLPGDARVRISLDTELTLIREDNWDGKQRSGNNWRRTDIGIDYPFDQLPAGDVERFPYGVLEVKLQTQMGQQPPKWVRELVSSHLVEAVPKFSKFIHGCATLLSNRVDLVPFWLPQMDTDIRKPVSMDLALDRPQHSSRSSETGSVHKTPHYEPVSEEEFEDNDDEENVHQIADEQQEANNLGLSALDPRIKEIREQREKYLAEHRQESEGAQSEASKAPTKERARPKSNERSTPATRQDILSPAKVFDKNYLDRLGLHNISKLWHHQPASSDPSADSRDDADDEDQRIIAALQGRDEEEPRASGSGPPADVEYVSNVQAQPGKKVSVPIRVEPKVYFANERTFLKWLEFSVLLASISTGLLNFQTKGDRAGMITAAVFTMVSLFAVAYSGVLYVWRALKIRERSASNVYFDSYGPTFLCFSILGAMLANLVLRWMEGNESRIMRGLAN
ncbi:vacuolar transporter chaperone [Malassezia psittaci]|uniref:Vacuolar transporter chaperone complex subunit 4 n=1 Tax=Malassezia psittaci TaxID=1821823 RepID=A0AAF0JEZ2_9BASI|nr:vacuolar transporter chaperone [Malassezia psittaci]